MKRETMTMLEVFGPPMCCATGVCGADVDPRLPQFAADLAWLAGHGVPVARYNLAQEPAAFVANTMVRDLMGRWGSSCLPLLVQSDKILARGRYPSRAELTAMVGLSESVP
jgi:hypothetical protein